MHHTLIQHDEDGAPYVEFPVHARLDVTEKGNHVLRPDCKHIAHSILVPCGYRGSSKVWLEGTDISEIRYHVYRSPRGSLGIMEGAIVSCTGPLRVGWSRSGRLYGADPTGTFIIRPDGTVEEELDDLDDLLE